jgi:hypothetical protein
MHACDPASAIEKEEIAEARETVGEKGACTEDYSGREYILHGRDDVLKENPISNRQPLRQYTGRQAFFHTFNKNLCSVEVLRMNYNEIFEYMDPY